MANTGRRHDLSNRLVDGLPLPPAGRSVFLWDNQVRGFGIRIMSTGAHVFYVDYRTRDAKRQRKRMPIGKYSILSCSEARELGRRTLAAIEWGKDPLEERRTRREALTVASLCDRYLADAEKGLVRGKGGQPKKASTLYIDKGRIDRHIKPLLGKRLVAELKSSDLAKFQMDVANGKTRAVVKTERKRGKAIVEGGRGTAKKALGLMGGMLSYAKDLGIIETNPAHGVRRMADGVRDRRLTPDEYRALGVALDAAEDDGATWQAIAGVKLLALTGCRLGEIQKLRWSEVDEARGCLRLSDSKEGKSTRPVGQAAFDVLNSLPQPGDEDPGAYVLTRIRGVGPCAGLAKAVADITALAKLEGVTAHTFRHSLASTAADMGMSLPTIGALLGHSSGGVTSRYIHQLDAVLVAAADRVAGEISLQMAGKTGQVYRLPRAG